MVQLRITQTRSAIRHTERQKRTLEALGIRRMHHSVTRNDSPQVRGMIARVHHLVTVEEMAPAKKAARKAPKKAANAAENTAENGE
jgi:large subunit ribosomal protein L30